MRAKLSFCFLSVVVASGFLFGCGQYLSQMDLWVPTPRGLNLSVLTSETTPTTQTAITSSLSLIDSDTLTPAGSGSWVSNADANRIDSTYQYLLCDGTTNSLSGTVVTAARSHLLLAHQVTTDSATLTITIDGSVAMTIPEGTAAVGWVNTDLGAVSAGVHTIQISTSDTWPHFAYLDGLVVLPVTTMDSGVQRLGWFEHDHPHFYTQGLWALWPRSATFPYSVATSTGTGETRSSNANDSITFVVDAGVTGGALRIFGQSAADEGILHVFIDDVAQADFDQYLATTDYRTYQDYTLTNGEHLVKLAVSGAKNAASSGATVYFDAAELRLTAMDDEARAKAMVNSIVSNIDSTDGAQRTAYDSSLYNQDNDSGYSLMALGLAVARWNISDHVQALKRNIQWFADIVQDDGVWYWGYCKQGDTDCPRSYIVAASNANCISNYCPSVNSYYTGLSPAITAIRSIDAPQSYPAVALAIYASLYPQDSDFINSVKPKILKGIDALIANNYDASNGYFYSSYQYINGTGWSLYQMQYSAGQCDVFMGLMSAYSLSGDAKYKAYADYIKQNFDRDFYDSSRGLYSLGLSGPMGGTKTMDTSYYYGFTQGYCNWVFGPGVLTHGATAVATESSWLQGDGYSVQVPGVSEAETSESAWLLMGLSSLNTNSTLQSNLKQRFRNFQFEFSPELQYGHGGVKFSVGSPYLYTSDAAWAFLALTQQTSPSLWWR